MAPLIVGMKIPGVHTITEQNLKPGRLKNLKDQYPYLLSLIVEQSTPNRLVRVQFFEEMPFIWEISSMVEQAAVNRYTGVRFTYFPPKFAYLDDAA